MLVCRFICKTEGRLNNGIHLSENADVLLFIPRRPPSPTVPPSVLRLFTDRFFRKDCTTGLLAQIS
jgi:hypothetical protein